MSHIILVAFEVEDDTREQAEQHLMRHLVPILRDRDETRGIECWWIAEDDRHDGSDNDSAVFVKPGSQRAASMALHDLGFTASVNVKGK